MMYDPDIGIPHICHGHTDGVRGEQICHVEKFQTSVLETCGESQNFSTWINFKFLHMTDAEKSEISFVVCTIYGILLHFFAFYAGLSQNRFLRLTRYCVEKIEPKIVPVEKKLQI